ncbi:MAG: hypothetical protein GQ529_09885, partial [Methyloprofundus sp.]|nr:hypothetical protein [Methyloprofundus sp.]
QADKDSQYIKQSSLVLICCVLLGSLIIGGSSILIASIPWLFLLVALWFIVLSPDKKSFADFIAGIYLKLTSSSTNNESKTFQIDSLGMFETDITHTSGEQETIRNSKLLSTCSGFGNEVTKDS